MRRAPRTRITVRSKQDNPTPLSGSSSKLVNPPTLLLSSRTLQVRFSPHPPAHSSVACLELLFSDTALVRSRQAPHAPLPRRAKAAPGALAYATQQSIAAACTTHGTVQHLPTSFRPFMASMRAMRAAGHRSLRQCSQQATPHEDLPTSAELVQKRDALQLRISRLQHSHPRLLLAAKKLSQGLFSLQAGPGPPSLLAAKKLPCLLRHRIVIIM